MTPYIWLSFFVNLPENWYRMRKIKIFVKYLEEGVEQGHLLNYERTVSQINFLKNYLLLLIFILLSTLVHEIPIWTFLTHFWVDDVTTGSEIFKI